MALFGIGRKPERVESGNNAMREMSESQKIEPTSTRQAKARKLFEEAGVRVRDLKTRLSSARWKVVTLEVQLKAAQEAAVEAVVVGGEPPSLTEREIELGAAQRKIEILEKALERATDLLRSAEAGLEQATQAELDDNFANTLRELMEHAAKMAESHGRLCEIHVSAEGRYSSELLWPAFAPDGYYTQWLRAVEGFVSQSRARGQKEPMVVSGASAPKAVEPTAERHTVESAGMTGWTVSLLRPRDA